MWLRWHFCFAPEEFSKTLTHIAAKHCCPDLILKPSRNPCIMCSYQAKLAVADWSAQTQWELHPVTHIWRSGSWISHHLAWCWNLLTPKKSQPKSSMWKTVWWPNYFSVEIILKHTFLLNIPWRLFHDCNRMCSLNGMMAIHSGPEEDLINHVHQPNHCVHHPLLRHYGEKLY